jgi:hypothetical protein
MDMHKNTKLAIAELLIAGGIFSLDVILSGGIIASLYVIMVLISLLSSDSMFIVWNTIVVAILIGLGLWYNGGISAGGDEILLRCFALIIISLTAVLSIQRKEIENKLKDLNLNLELQVLARTAASENNALRLEKQIKALESINREKKTEAFQTLDDVINNLRDLTDDELDIDVEFVDGDR